MIKNAIEEKLNTVMYETPCGCKIHVTRVFNENGELESMSPIDKYYGYDLNRNVVLHETIRCDRHSNILDITELHLKISEENILKEKAKKIIIDNLPDNLLRIEKDEETNEIFKRPKNLITFTFENDQIVVFPGEINSEIRNTIKQLWDTLLGENKVKFYGE